MKLTLPQQHIANSKARYKLVAAGRRFGKTFLSIRQLAYMSRMPNKNVYYIAPTYRMAKQIVWEPLKARLMDLRWVDSKHETDLTIRLINGSTISLRGADNPDSLRGISLDYVVFDEFADISLRTWSEVIRPTLADRQGGALFIGTPKGTGNHFYDMWLRASELDNWQAWQFTTLDGGNVTAEELEAARAELDARTFEQEFLASFLTAGNRVWYGFDRTRNVKEFDDKLPHTLYTGWDFNIDPMSVVVFARQGDVIHAIDEIEIYGSNTQEAIDELNNRYKQRIFAYPDPASRQRKTSAGGMTDLRLLQNAGFTVKCPHKHNPVRDGINAVNAMLSPGNGEPRFYVSPRCKKLIECLDKQAYKPGTTIPDKNSGYDHMSDAMRYYIDYEFPVQRVIETITAPQRWAHR